MQKQRENIKKYTFALLAMFALSVLFLTPVSSPARAQGFVTPTPLPSVRATQQAADWIAQQVQQQNAEAAQMEARAAEIRRNAAAQAQQAAQAYADARAAAAAQNAAAIGEAIGRGEAALSQLQDSVNGLTALNATQASRIEMLSSAVVSQANTINRLAAEKRDTLNVNAALMAKQAQNDNLDALGRIVMLFGFIVTLAILAHLIWSVWQRNRVTIVAPPPPQDVDEEDVIEGERAE